MPSHLSAEIANLAARTRSEVARTSTARVASAEGVHILEECRSIPANKSGEGGFEPLLKQRRIKKLRRKKRAR
jgi:hypothetical protein